MDFAHGRFADLDGVLAELARQGPVVEVRYFGEPAWLFTGHDEVAAAFRDEDTFPSGAAYSLFAEPVQGRTLQCMAGEEHRRNRALVSPAVRPAAIGDVDPLLREVVHGVVDRIAGRDEVDLVTDVARPIPFTVITRLLGIPQDAHADFFRWADALFSFPVDPDGALEAAAEFTRYLTPVIADRRREPGDDLISQLAATDLSDEEICSFVRLLFPAGADTTYLAIASLLLAVLPDRDAWAAAATDPDVRQHCVDETLRFAPPVAIQPRRSVAPSRWGDVDVPADAWVLFAIAAANRHDTAAPILTFGAGAHYCLGAHLARQELLVALEVLAQRLPDLTLTDPGSVSVEGAILRGPTALPAYLNGPAVPGAASARC